MSNQTQYRTMFATSNDYFEKSFNEKLKEASSIINSSQDQDIDLGEIKSLCRPPELILAEPQQGNYCASSPKCPDTAQRLLQQISSEQQSPIDIDDSSKRRIAQERNRISASKSRQKKKQEWVRLLESEKNLRIENEVLKQRISSLEQHLKHEDGSF